MAVRPTSDHWSAIGYTNTASGLSLGTNYSPGAGLSAYAAVTTDSGGQAGAGATSLGVGFSRDEGAGAFVQRGNAADGQGRISFNERDGLGASFRNSTGTISASQRGGTTLETTGPGGLRNNDPPARLYARL